MKKFLVVGGAGFIGSNIVDSFLEKGYFVRVLDNFFSGKEENLRNASQNYGKDRFELIKGDMRNTGDCDKSCEGMDYVLLLAALRSVPRSFNAPEDYNEVNVGGTLKMLQAAAKHKIKRFVFSSSSSVYGDSDTFPLKESQPTNPISPYAITKLAGEGYCRVFSKFYGLETVCLRYFNVFGPKQALDDDYAVVIPKFIKCIVNNENPPIFGDGKQSRDFTFIDNVVLANELAAIKEGIVHEVFNVARGEEHTVLETSDLINKVLGKSVEPVHLEPRVGDIYRTFADISKVKDLLGYELPIGFEEGLEKTIQFFQQ